MSSSLNKLRAYAELARISNLPTTFSNVLVGAAIGISSANASATTDDLWMIIPLAWIAIACFYMAGMAMNDLFDAKIDRTERPHRPIPSRRVSAGGAMRFIVGLMLIGFIAAAALGVPALLATGVLAALIVFYNLFHAKTAASVVLLGLARAMVYVVAALAVAEAVDWRLIKVLGGALVLYTIGFSLIARNEMRPHPGTSRWLAEVIVLIAIVPIFIIPPRDWTMILLPLLLVTAWLSRGVGMVFASPPSTKQAVMIWISGICLIDALYLALLDQGVWWVVANACFIATTIAQRRIAGT